MKIKIKQKGKERIITLCISKCSGSVQTHVCELQLSSTQGESSFTGYNSYRLKRCTMIMIWMNETLNLFVTNCLTGCLCLAFSVPLSLSFSLQFTHENKSCQYESTRNGTVVKK
uniref:Uncharacterized protein n=1 Tax=Anopheles quadriannulatus TaxID=34691 RepID=A0A182XSV3_ANOQN